jgi:hypothetical protein
VALFVVRIFIEQSLTAVQEIVDVAELRRRFAEDSEAAARAPLLSKKKSKDTKKAASKEAVGEKKQEALPELKEVSTDEEMMD